MPRGENPKSRANLIKNSERTPKELREIATKGGKRSGEVRRLEKSFKEIDQETTTEEEKRKMWESLKKAAMQGNLKAFEIYRDTIGEKPTTTANVNLTKPVIVNPFANLTEEELRRLAYEE